MTDASAPVAQGPDGRGLHRGVVLGLVPVMTLAAHALGGSLWMAAGAAGLQALWLWRTLARPVPAAAALPGRGHAPRTGRETVDRLLAAEPETGSARTAALAVRLDDAARLEERHGARYAAALRHELGHRLGTALRDADAFCPLDDRGFGIALSPQRHLELGTVLAIAHRIQAQLGQSFSFESVTVWPSVSIGFCMSPRAARLSGLGMLAAAEQAAERALRDGPGGLSSYSAVDFPGRVTGERQQSLREALESGAIHAHFQPQVEAASGGVSGFEALARWQHPQRGLLPPADFLPAIDAGGLAGLLAERMLRDALALLARLDAAGLKVPSVAINLSTPALRNPHLADEIAWELDRHNLTPQRLVIELLETVVADSDDDVMVRNIARLAELGCGIDLDDFGTGHASIANIRRFAVSRIKIDRSFVSHLHHDRDRQRMVAAIVSMANELELGTLAEGIETPEERETATRLGCGHLQGFGIARPMPPEAVADWVRAHDSAETAAMPRLGRDPG